MSDVLQSLKDKLGEINLYTTYVVDDDFIIEREHKVHTYKDNNGKKRTPDERRLDVDCEFVDKLVTESGKDYIKPPSESKKHDFIFVEDKDYFVDNKVVHEDVFWLHMNKYMQYLESYRQGKLHYFAFWKYMDRPTKPLKVGDKPEFLLLNVIDAGVLLETMCDPRKMTRAKDKFKVEVI